VVKNKADILFKDESYKIIGACFEVYKEMGCGFLEPVYHECLEIELAARAIPFVSQCQLTLRYKQQLLRQLYVPDFICFDQIILEIKAVTDVNNVHRAQVHNSLKATKLRLGLLVNFGHHLGVQHERIVR
jgi:GxxExxY protein